MRTWTIGIVAFALTAGVVQAHMIWVVPNAKGDAAIVVWSDYPEPDNVDEKLTTIASAKVLIRGADGKTKELKWTEDKDVYRLACAGDEARTLMVVWQGDYGSYTAKAYLPDSKGKIDLGEKGKAWEGVDMELLPRPDLNADTYQVLFKGKPLAGVSIRAHKQSETITSPKTDKDGLAVVKLEAGEVYGLRALYRLKDPVKKTEQFFTTTLVVRTPAK